MRIGVLGATGMVGEELLRILNSFSQFPVDDLVLLATPRNAGKRRRVRGRDYTVLPPASQDFGKIDLLFGVADEDFTKKILPSLPPHTLFVDSSPALRRNPSVPLVIPEINFEAITPGTRAVSSPNAAVTLTLMALAPMHKAWILTRLITTSFQSTSGAGKETMQHLERDSKSFLTGNAPHIPMSSPAFNVLPELGEVDTTSSFANEEEKMHGEVRKILDLPDLPILATSVRVPVFIGHSISVAATFAKPVSRKRANAVLSKAPGIVLRDHGIDLCPRAQVGEDAVAVGRLRSFPRAPNTLGFFVSGDNLRKGAALNLVQIARRILEEKLWSPPGR